MYNAALMAILDSVDDLPKLIPSVRFSQSPVTSYEVCTTGTTTSFTILQHTGIEYGLLGLQPPKRV